MTCIVGLKQEDKIYIGGDALGSNYRLQKTVRADEKVFKKGEMIFGFTTSFRLGNILRYCLSLPSRPEGIDDMTYLVAYFVPSLMKAFSDGQYLKTDKGEASGGTFLMGYRKELYAIYDDFQVSKSMLNYEACGCGEDFAKGSLFVTQKYLLSPEEKINMALDAASEHSAGVSPPYTIVNI